MLDVHPARHAAHGWRDFFVQKEIELDIGLPSKHSELVLLTVYNLLVTH